MRLSPFLRLFLPLALLSPLGCWGILGGDLARDRAADTDAGTDAATLDAAGVDVGPTDQSDFYVDPSAPPGTAFTTITAALAAASASSHALKTVHVAAGTYSARTGEVFPLVVRGVILMGAESGRTIIQGGAVTGIARAPVASESDVVATLVVGDSVAFTALARLSIVPATGPKAPGTEGIVCDRGNAIAAGFPDPNTNLTDVTVDGFDVGLRVMDSVEPTPSGCAIFVAASTFRNGGFGVYAEGSIDASKGPRYVTVQLGNDVPANGNTFENFQVTDAARGTGIWMNGSGFQARDAVHGIVVENNKFSASDQGILLWQTSALHDQTGASIEDNDFGTMRNAGIQLWGQPVVAQLLTNAFHDISTPDDDKAMTFAGVGLVMDGLDTGSLPVVRYARHNTFFGNDVGLNLRTTGNVPTDDAHTSDFGTPHDEGGNVFRCNGVGARHLGRTTSPSGGGDVVVSFAWLSLRTIAFEGNFWDHAPVPTYEPASAPAGIDTAVLGATLDLESATVSTSPPCPSGIPVGPPE
jgi:hypothetical protein